MMIKKNLETLQDRQNCQRTKIVPIKSPKNTLNQNDDKEQV